LLICRSIFLGSLIVSFFMPLIFIKGMKLILFYPQLYMSFIIVYWLNPEP